MAGSIVELMDSTYAVLDGAMVIHKADQSRVSGLMAMAMRNIFLKTHVRYFKQEGKTLTVYHNVSAAGRNSYGADDLLLQLANWFGSEIDEDERLFEWKGLTIKTSTLSSSTLHLMERLLPAKLGDADVIVEDVNVYANGGIENEAAILEIISKHLSIYPCIDVKFTDPNGRIALYSNVVDAVHTGMEYELKNGKSDIALVQKDKSLIHLSIKSKHTIEWDGGQCAKRDSEFADFTRLAISKNLIKTVSTAKKNTFNCRIMASNKSQIVAIPSRRLMDHVVFGFPDSIRCDAVIIGNFYANQVDGISFCDGDATHNPKLSIKASLVASTIDDLMNTDYEPRLMIGSRQTGMITLSNRDSYANYKGIYVSARPRRRINGKGKLKPSSTTCFIENLA